MNIVLYYLSGSRAHRVRWMLEELELNYKLEHIDLFKGEGNTPEYLALNPLGQLPAITFDGSPMFESGAIVQWLADSNLEKGFAPPLDSPLRREFEQWMYFSVTNLEMPAWEVVLHGKILPEEVAVKQIIPFATEKLLQVLAVLEQALEGKSYMVGDQFSAVDIMIGYILKWFPEHIEHFTNLLIYTQNIQQRPAYVRSSQE
jgi:glutathione S-transferase